MSASAGISQLIFPVINFSIYLGIGAYLYKKHGAKILLQRSKEVVANIAKSQSEMRAAESELSDANDLIAGLEDEKQSILDSYREEGRVLAEQIVIQTKEAARIRMSEIDQKILQEKNSLAQEVRQQILTQAQILVSKKLKEEITTELDQKLRESVIDSI